MEIRSLDPADLDAALDIRIRSLGPLPESSQETWRDLVRRALAGDLVLGCYDGTRLMAMARINRYGQWWSGQSLPMAGVGGVVVAPEDRGKGVGRRLMRGTLDRAAAAGFALSALYPATVSVYRGCGWEFGGVQQHVTVPTEALRTLATTRVPLRRVGPDDAGEILAVVRAIHAARRSCGPIDWPLSEVRSWLADEEPFAYLAPDGFLAYQWDDGNLAVDELLAGSGETARALWSIVGSGSSVAASVSACLGPDDPLRWLTQESVVRPAKENRWMLRLVDLAAALAGRGYPAGVKAEAIFTVDDPQLPGNTGTWRLSVADGRAQPERITPTTGTLNLTAGGVAALYAGTPLSTLRIAGLATGGDADRDTLLDAIFAARPYLLDYF